MDALQHLETILELANSAPADQCPHITFEHVAGLDGMHEAESMALLMLGEVFDAVVSGRIDLDTAYGAAAHVLVVVAALGYALGSDETAETFQSVQVPDDIASLDFLEPTLGDN